MVKTQQQAGGPDLVQRQNPSEKILETFQPVVGGIDLTPGRIPLWPVVGGTYLTSRRIPLGSKSKIDIITDLEKGEKLEPLSYSPRWSRPVEHQGDPQERNPMFVNVGGGAAHERCIVIPQWTGIRPEVVGTWRMAISMTVGVQQTGDRSVATCTLYSGDDLNIEATNPSQQKTTKRQRTGNRLMAIDTRPNYKVPYSGRDRPSSRTTARLQGML